MMLMAYIELKKKARDLKRVWWSEKGKICVLRLKLTIFRATNVLYAEWNGSFCARILCICRALKQIVGMLY